MPVPAPSPEFLDALATLGLELEAEDLRRLGAFLERLYAANETMNLTRVPQDAAWMRHIFDSLTLVPWIVSLRVEAMADAERRANTDVAAGHARSAAQSSTGPSGPIILDVGSGGGLPGLPLAIVLSSILPGARVTLLEATGKKARFLEEVSRELGLEGICVIAERAETAAHERHAHRERYDAVVSRAVGALTVLAELTIPFARPGGFVMVIKGERALAEVEEARHAIGLLGGSFVESKVTLTGTLLRIEKGSRTPRTYPRLPGEPSRKPLVARRERGP